MVFSRFSLRKLLLLLSISLTFELIKADNIYPWNSANSQAIDFDESFPITIGSNNDGLSTETRQQTLDAPPTNDDAHLALLVNYIIAADKQSNTCEIKSSSKRRARRRDDDIKKDDSCVTIPPASSETKPEQNNDAGDNPEGEKPPTKQQPRKSVPFDPATEPPFSGFHFRENTSVCPHQSSSIPVCALRTDERDWATSTSVSFFSTLLECVACM